MMKKYIKIALVLNALALCVSGVVVAGESEATNNPKPGSSKATVGSKATFGSKAPVNGVDSKQWKRITKLEKLQAYTLSQLKRMAKKVGFEMDPYDKAKASAGAVKRYQEKSAKKKAKVAAKKVTASKAE